MEVVSNRKGGELSNKLLDYARAGIIYYVVFYYVVFDPFRELGDALLRVFTRRSGSFREISQRWLEEVELGLTLWKGPYEDWPPTLWLRWVDKNGNLTPTGAEAVVMVSQRPDEASQRAEEAESQAREDRRQREELLAKLRERGIDPDTL